MSKLVSKLYKMARQVNDMETIASGDPKKINRRLKNKYIGKKIARKTNKWPF